MGLQSMRVLALFSLLTTASCQDIFLGKSLEKSSYIGNRFEHAGIDVSLPSSMRLVFRDSSDDCAPPSFNCISVQRGPLPLLRADSVLVRVSGSSVNHDDTAVKGDIAPYYRNTTMGFEASGVVVAVGEECQKFTKGDHVWSTIPRYTSAFHGSGGLAEYATLTCAYTGFAPSPINASVAGTLPTDAATALGALQSAGAPWTGKDVTVLIVAGTGGTGYSGVQLAKALGATKVVTAAGSADDVAFVKALGADVAVDYHNESVFDSVPDGSVDVIFDNHGTVPGPVLKKLKSPGGTFVSIVTKKMDPQPPKGVTQLHYYIWSDDQLPTLANKLDSLAGFIDAGSFRAIVDDTYDFDHIKEAYTRLIVKGHLKSRISVVP